MKLWEMDSLILLVEIVIHILVLSIRDVVRIYCMRERERESEHIKIY